MFVNYWKSAVRNLLRHKGYSLINVFGLAVGLAVCTLILLWVQDELSFDRFHANKDQLYRVVYGSVNDSPLEGSLITPFLLAPALKEQVPEVILASRLSDDEGQVIRVGDDRFYGNDVYRVDNDFLDMFSFPVLMGADHDALKDPSSVVITQSVAAKCFGDVNPVGRTLTLDRHDYTVSAVLADVPVKSHLRFDCLLSVYSSSPEFIKMVSRWQCGSHYSYIMLEEHAQPAVVEDKISRFFRSQVGDTMSAMYLQPLTDVHLHSASMNFGFEDAGDIGKVYLFSGLAVLILLIACVNFMNLSTARASTRVREIGMRKVVGADRAQLGAQFVGEAVLFALLALVLAVGAVELCLPGFSSWCGKDLRLDLTHNGAMAAALGLLTLLTGLVAGSYPASYLSRLRPVQIVKASTVQGAAGAVWLRRFLVVTQFALSVFLLIAAGTIHGQLTYMAEGDLGYDSDNVFCVETSGTNPDSVAILKQEVLSLPGVVSATHSMPPTSLFYSTDDVRWDGKDTTKRASICRHQVDCDYFRTFGMQLAAGRFFSEDRATDATGYVINERAAALMGESNPVGKTLTYDGREGEIIGVVKDYYYQNLRGRTFPLALEMTPPGYGALSIKVHPDHARELREHLERRWRELFPDFNWDGYFLDDRMADFYANERRTGMLVGWSSVLAVLVSCLGLLGLAAHAAGRRSKEVGVRKVLGATVGALIGLLTREFALLVALANVVAWPVAYLVMKNWLDDFAYRASISPWLFVGAAAVSLGLALVTVSILTFRTANTNPSDVLRQE